MIKTLKLSDKSVRRFKSHKKWKYTTLDQGDSIVLEQGEDLPIFIDTDFKLATEQNQSDFTLSIKHGKNIKGTFFKEDSKYYNSETEPMNYDGSYQRVVYNSIKHLFYNTYGVGQIFNDEISEISSTTYNKNPMYVFGSETGIYDSTAYNSDVIGMSPNKTERRMLGDSVSLVEIPSDVFGEKIKPTSFKISDYSSRYGVIEIEDDGATNLVVGGDTFNKVDELWSGPSEEIIPDDDEVIFDHSDLSHGHSLSSSGNYLLVGAPVSFTSPSELQTGKATLYKNNKETNRFEMVKEFYCPFTQNGLAIESQNDNTGFLVTELGSLLSSSSFSINDNFGTSVEISWGMCAIGSPTSHITGTNNDQPTGHVFIYDKNKGGQENYGLINILEGEPGSEFGNSVSIYDNYMVIGSPELKNSKGGVYVYKKTKRTKTHPWIRTSTIFESYTQSASGLYVGHPQQDNEPYRKYLKQRDEIVSSKINSHRTQLKKDLDAGTISEQEYYRGITVDEDYSQVYPYNLLTQEQKEYYQHSVWPGYMTDEVTGNYIPNPDHEQNETNKWASRWKVESVIGNSKPIKSFESTSECDDSVLSTFDNEDLNVENSDLNFPINKYSESPDNSLGDTTWDLVGFIPCPVGPIYRFGEKVKLNKDMIYITNPSSNNPECFVYKKSENDHGCEVWELTHRINEKEINGTQPRPLLSEQFNSVKIDVSENYINISVCPSTTEYDTWAYQFDRDLTSYDSIRLDDNTENYAAGISMQNCKFSCDETLQYNYYSRIKKINGEQVGFLEHNTGTSVSIGSLIENDYLNNDKNATFYSKGKLDDSYTSGLNENSTGISWKNFRENISFVFPDVPSGTEPSFMTIYSPGAKGGDGKYDPMHTLAEIGAQETLNGKRVRLIINSANNTNEHEEHFIDFIYRGTKSGTHYTLNELHTSIEYECTLPPNFGNSIELDDIWFEDPLGNKSNAKFYSKSETHLSYIDDYHTNDTMALSWKNFRENVSFSYPLCKSGTRASFMTIYSDEAKQPDGSYDPMHTLAEIGAQETLNGKTVRLTINTGTPTKAFPEYHYDFTYMGSVQGTHFTVSELRENFKYERTLPPNSGVSVKIDDDKFGVGDFLRNEKHARFFGKSELGLSYLDPDANEGELALSWKNFREDVSFSYPVCQSGETPAFMTIYADEAKLYNGSYDPIYTLAEIGAQDTLNGKTVRLTLNSGRGVGKESYYEFEFRGTIRGTHFTLSELRKNYDPDWSELPANLGHIKNLKNIDFDDRYGKCKPKLFFSKGEYDLSYIDEFSPPESMALSWKNFREDISFSYPICKPTGVPSFMTIYSNNAKTESGSYDPAYTLAEIGADAALNGKRVKLIMNSSNCGSRDKTMYYEFIFHGNQQGSHYILNELNYNVDYECTLPPNYGEYVELDSIGLTDFLNTPSGPKFFGKTESQLSYLEPNVSSTKLAISWKNFRENVSFSYPAVHAGTTPAFMTIYSDHAKQPDGTYDPAYTLAEIGAQETLNGKQVRLTLNTGSVGGTEFYYEFLFAGTEVGTHHTLQELVDSDLFIELRDSEHIKPNTLHTPQRIYEKTIEKQTRTTKIKKIKSVGSIPANLGSKVGIENMTSDDYLNNKENASFYSKDIQQDSYSEKVGYENEIAFSWKNFREGVSFSYPITNSGSSPSFMTIYSNKAKQSDGTYDPLYTLAEIGAQETLNGEIVRLTFNTGSTNKDNAEHYYEFIYDGSIEGTHFTLDELETEISPRLNLPLLVYSPLPKNCRVRINKEDLTPGRHRLFVGLVDSGGILIGEQSVATFYNNPHPNNTPSRHSQVKKRYRYNYDINKKFGQSVDANDDYLILGNPHDREYTPLNNQFKTYTAGAVYVYSINDYGINILDKVYGDSDIETNFNYMFGNDVSLLGNNFLVGGHADEYTKISVSDVIGGSEVQLQDLSVGATNYKDDEYTSTEVLITNFEYDMNSEHGDMVIRIDIDSLGIDESKVSELDVRADFIDTGEDSIRIDGYRGESANIANGVYLRASSPIEVSPGCDVLTFNTTPTYVNNNGCCIYWSKERNKWVLSDEPYVEVDNFATSNESSISDVPSSFIEGFGIFENQVVGVVTQNDIVGNNGFLTRGVYRNYTKIVADQVWVYVNKLPNSQISDTLLFIYNVAKNAVQGYASYYSIENGNVNHLKKIKTNKDKFHARKQYAHSVSLSSDFMFVGSPVLGDFEIDELITFGGSSISMIGGASRMFMKFRDFYPGSLNDFRKNITGLVVSYDHGAVRDNMKYYLGNVFYKNGILSLTDTDGYFSNILTNSGVRGYEIEFKGTQTLYENEIICRVDPHEFNVSTNPTATKKGTIPFDINGDGVFDITDVIYIYRFLLGTLVVDDGSIDDDDGLSIGDDAPNWPTTDLILTESEDLLLMDMFDNAKYNENLVDMEAINERLLRLKDTGELDFDGDGNASETDAKLLIRYFMGRTGDSLTRGLVNRFGTAKRKNASDIISYLDEKTGKFLGVQLLDEFLNYKENDAVDKLGSYLAPYATSIGLYSGLDLVMVAKLGKPVKILPNYPINFLIKFDT